MSGPAHDAADPAPVRILPGRGPVVITCEHASDRLPPPWTWPPADRHLRGTHWALDLGVADLVAELHAATGWPAVLADFCRLLADPNRAEEHPDLVRTHADGAPIALNQHVDAAERVRRLDRFHRPYHAAVERLVVDNPGAALLSIHSFTDVYEGSRRTLELGVLFDRDEAIATAMAEDLRALGHRVGLNAPWSGRDGLIYGANHHALGYDRVCIELEFRQDLLGDPEWRAAVVGQVIAIVRRRMAPG